MSKPTCRTDKYGNKIWKLNGELHRLDGPAIEFFDGTKEWYLNGVMHREDGPAIELSNGRKIWYLHGKELSEEEHLELVSKENQIKILFRTKE